MSHFCLAEDGFDSVWADGLDTQKLQKRRSAIYFWMAENGEAYVGQAVDVQSRLRQHFKNHRDLVSAAFIDVGEGLLDSEERRLVALAEREFPLRNIKLVKKSASHLPLDDFMTLPEQDDFVRRGISEFHLKETRREFPILAARSRVKIDRFQSDGEAGQVLKSLVTTFVLSAIPRPLATENRFWSVTYLGPRSARINVGQQELFTCNVLDGEVVVRVIAPKRLRWFAPRTSYETGDFENVLSESAFRKLSSSSRKFRPVRERAVWLARHTTPLNLASHCPWLFDPDLATTSNGTNL